MSLFFDPKFTVEQLFKATVAFWDAWVAPNNLKQCYFINSTLLSIDVIGQVDVTGVYNGQQLNTGYIFCLFTNSLPTPDYFSLIEVPINYTMIHFTAVDYIVNFAIIVDFDPLKSSQPLEVDGSMTFDSDLKVTQYDMLMKRFDRLLDTIYIDFVVLLQAPNITSALAEIG